MNEIMDNGPDVKWDDIAGLKVAKTTIQVRRIERQSSNLPSFSRDINYN